METLQSNISTESVLSADAMSTPGFRLYDIIIDSPPISDERINNRFLMGAPLKPVLLVIFYLFFIYKLGPRFMQSRQPFNLRTILIVYNSFQIVANAVLLFAIYRVVPHLSLLCANTNQQRNFITKLSLECHYYYNLLKILDLVETVFFVLRKNSRQISFLHVHHHIGMIAAAWISCNYFPGLQAMYVGLLNTFAHSVMYVYYLLSIINPNYRKSLWWKKYVTMLQIVQNSLIFCVMVPTFVNPSCGFPKGCAALFLLNNLINVYLFIRFYRKSYMKKSD